jgi:hypothetical protein
LRDAQDEDCWLEFREGELLREAQLGVRVIKTRSAGLEFGGGELLREAQLGVGRITTRSAGSQFGEGELLRNTQLVNKAKEPTSLDRGRGSYLEIAS